MKEKYLSKIEVNLPITLKTARRKILPRIVDFFLDTDGIGGCTYTLPTQPPIMKGVWFQKNKPIAKTFFNDTKLVSALLKEKIIEDKEKDAAYVIFSDSINNENELKERLLKLKLDDKKTERVMDAWQELKIVDDISWIYACYDLEHANVDIRMVISYIKQMIESEGGETLAWITYCPVAIHT